jgi:regulator of sigma D
LDAGIKEERFWNMTFAEIERELSSYARVEKFRAQEKASYDYILADLIGRSVARVYSANNTFPEIAEAYPTLFNTKDIEEQKAIKKAELSAIRFKHFAETYNKRFRGEQKE